MEEPSTLTPTASVVMYTILGDMETPSEDYGRFHVIQFTPSVQEYQVVDPETGSVMASYTDVQVARNFAKRLPLELDIDRIETHRKNGGLTEADKADIRALDQQMRHESWVHRRHAEALIKAAEYR